MKRLMQYTILVTITLLLLYTLNIFVGAGRYGALLSSELVSLWRNPHQPVEIKVDVVSDSAFPQQEAILAAVSESFAQFRPAGINFSLASFNVRPIVAGEENQLKSDKLGHVTVILSGNSQAIRSDHQWLDAAGLAYPQKKLVIVAISKETILNSPRLVSTLQHELAHLFYVEHDEAGSTYVMSPVANSSTTWSPAARARLNKMRYRFL